MKKRLYKIIWRTKSLSELTPYWILSGLSHWSSEASIYIVGDYLIIIYIIINFFFSSKIYKLTKRLIKTTRPITAFRPIYLQLSLRIMSLIIRVSRPRPTAFWMIENISMTFLSLFPMIEGYEALVKDVDIWRSPSLSEVTPY